MFMDYINWHKLYKKSLHKNIKFYLKGKFVIFLKVEFTSSLIT